MGIEVGGACGAQGCVGVCAGVWRAPSLCGLVVEDGRGAPPSAAGPAWGHANAKGVAMNVQDWVRRLVRPLESRKVRVALATVFAAYAAEHGFAWSEELVLTVVSVGVALILGIAHEDAGKAGAGSGPRVPGSGEERTAL